MIVQGSEYGCVIIIMVMQGMVVTTTLDIIYY